MTDVTPQPPKSGTPMWIKIALIASLALNLAVVGVVAGAAVNFNKQDGANQQRNDGPNPFLRAMSRQDARKVQRLLRPEAGQLGTSREAARASMQSVLLNLRSETFSEAELRTAFDQMTRANTARAGLAQEAIVTHLLTLNAQERAEFADRLEESLSRNGRRGQGRPPRQP